MKNSTYSDPPPASISKTLKLHCCEEEIFINETTGSEAISRRRLRGRIAPTTQEDGDIYMD